MNFKEQICRAVCDGFGVRKVPVGFAVSTPINWFSGDSLSFFARVEGAKARLEDSGALLFDLEGQGLDLSSESRRELLASLLQEHGVEFSEEEGTFSTPWMPTDEVAKLVPQFLAFLTRVQDLLFLSRDRVSSTFKEDLVAGLRERYGEAAEIEMGAAPIPDLPQYIVDIVVKHQSGKVAAIFPAISDVNVLRAALFSKELIINNVHHVVPFLIYEQVETPRVSSQSRAIAMNADLNHAVWSAGRGEVVDKVYRHVH